MSGEEPSHSLHTRIEQAPHVLHGGCAALFHIVQRTKAAKDAVGIWKAHPLVGKRPSMEVFNALKMPMR